jgi:hypothetical protein
LNRKILMGCDNEAGRVAKSDVTLQKSVEDGPNPTSTESGPASGPSSLVSGNSDVLTGKEESHVHPISSKY